MRVKICNDYDAMSAWAANYIASKINEAAPTAETPFKIGLPTGSTPVGTYRALIELYRAGKVSFKHVISFNMDEYIGLDEKHPQSYHYFMWSNFFDHIDIDPKNVHILDGMTADPIKESAAYEQAILDAGGIDLFLGGVGPDGHIAFNEPGSSLSSRTRVKTLTTDTIIANSRFFDNDISQVPQTALTVGVGTIMDAKEVVILINGHNKANALHQAIEGGVNHMYTVSALQMHPKGIIVCDEAACEELRVSTYRYFKDIERESL